LLTEGFEEVYFHYDWLDYSCSDDEALEEQADGKGWSFRLPSFLHRKSRVAKPSEVEPPLAAPKRTPQPAKPMAAAKPKAPVVPPQNLVTGGPSHPTTSIHYHQGLGLFSGTIHNKLFKPIPEKRFYSHLLSNHGFSGEHAERFIHNVKSGSATGFDKVTFQNHLDHAHRFLGMAVDHHQTGNQKLKDQHMEYFHRHMDHAYDSLEKHLKRNPNEVSLGANHPVFHQLARIEGRLHALAEPDERPQLTRRRGR
jgi:hypothetical protein